MLRILLLGFALSACSGGPTIPDGGQSCSIAADCTPNTTCGCPVIYQNCVDGVCSTTCPVEEGTPAGQACADDCECQSGSCGDGTCCPATRAGASGATCQQDCDCISVICSGNACM